MENLLKTLLFSDALREGAGEALAELKRLGLNRIILATGDRADVARRIAEGLPLDEIRAELTPLQKIELVQKEVRQAPTMMVGDGVNDAPALAAADIGLAMGLHGSAAAVEAADAVLLAERLERIGDGVQIARDCKPDSDAERRGRNRAIRSRHDRCIVRVSQTSRGRNCPGSD